MRTGQLARLGFRGSRWATNKRLRKLLDAGLVRAWVRSLAAENIYSLTPSGAAVVGKPEDLALTAVPRGLDGNLNHLLAINDVRILLALGVLEAGGELAWWRSDWDLRAHHQERLIPDALFAVRWPEAERAFALELDNRTKSPRGFLKKVVGYAALKRQRQGPYGVRDVVVLVVGRDPVWLDRYRRALYKLSHLPFFFAALADLGSQGALGSIWRRAEDEVRYPLRDLPNLPYGKEGSERKTLAIPQS